MVAFSFHCSLPGSAVLVVLLATTLLRKYSQQPSYTASHWPWGPEEGDSGCARMAWHDELVCVAVCRRDAAATSLSRVDDAWWGPAACHECGAWDSTTDPVFAFLSTLSDGWGRVLDAGCGAESVRWLVSEQQRMDNWTAVTASHAVAADVRSISAHATATHGHNRVEVGLWSNASLLRGEEFDTVLADWLVGAVEHYDPYHQRSVLRTLRSRLADGGRLVLVGYEPFPEPHTITLLQPKSLQTTARLLVDATAARDAMITLGGKRPYREFPLWWYQETLKELGFRTTVVKAFPVLYGAGWVQTQLEVGEQYLTNQGISASLANSLRDHSLRIASGARFDHRLNNGACFGMDFVLVADKVHPT